jgi:hypothetical protein
MLCIRARFSQAARSSVPFTALDVKLTGVVRHPDTCTAELTVVIKVPIRIAKPSMRVLKRQHRTRNCSFGRRTKHPGKIRAATSLFRLQELILRSMMEE